MDDQPRPRTPRPSSWRSSTPSTIKKATDDRLKRMIRDGHPDFALCLIELRSRYEARNTKMVESALAGLTPIMMDRYREILLYEMMCNIRHQFGG